MSREKTYKCVKGFTVPLCDDDGFEIPGVKAVQAGDVFRKTDADIIGGEIHLEEVKKPWHWLEIPKEMFDTYFE